MSEQGETNDTPDSPFLRLAELLAGAEDDDAAAAIWLAVTTSFPCAAYGEQCREVGALCFFAGDLHRRVCADAQQCSDRLGPERQRLFARFQEMSAHGDETGVYLADLFTNPEQLLGGDLPPPPIPGEDDDERSS